MLKFKNFIKEDININNDGKLNFDYGNKGNKSTVSTSFGKDKKFTPYKTKIIDGELTSYSLYKSHKDIRQKWGVVRFIVRVEQAITEHTQGLGVKCYIKGRWLCIEV